MAAWASIALAVLASMFTAGVFIATLRADVKRALRMAHRAHARIDELEDQTGTHTALRE